MAWRRTPQLPNNARESEGGQALSTILQMLAALAVFLFVGYLIVSAIRDQTDRALHQRRQTDVMSALDGKHEVQVRWDGTGMTIEQIVWHGRQHGYDLYCLKGSGGSARKLVMRRLPHGPPPHWTGYAYPHPAELTAIASDIRRTVNPEAIWSLAGLLTAVAGTLSFAAYEKHQAGENFTVPVSIAAVLVLAALGIVIAGRTALHRRRRIFAPKEGPGHPPVYRSPGGPQ